MSFQTQKDSNNAKIFDKNIELKNNYTREKIRLLLKIDGEKAVATKIDGNLDIYHNYNKILEKNSWNSNGVFVNKIKRNYHFQLAYIQTIEKILEKNIIIPERALYLRTFLLELERIINHLEFIAMIIKEISFPSLLLQLDELKKMAELLINFLVNDEKSFFIIGGVKRDIDNKLISFYLEELKRFQEKYYKIQNKFKRNHILKGLLLDVGFLSRESAKKLSLVGPLARSTGISTDIRKTDPYLIYDKIDFSIVVNDTCDLMGEILTRMDEVNESLNIIFHILSSIPSGIIILESKNLEVPANSTITRVESPSGELFTFAISKSGTIQDMPRIYKMDSTLKVNSQGFLARITGEPIEHISILISAIGEGWEKV